MLSLSRILQHWCVNWTLKVLLVLGLFTGHVCSDSHPGLHLKLVAIAGYGVHRLQLGSLPALSALSHYLMF